MSTGQTYRLHVSTRPGAPKEAQMKSKTHKHTHTHTDSRNIASAENEKNIHNRCSHTDVRIGGFINVRSLGTPGRIIGTRIRFSRLEMFPKSPQKVTRSLTECTSKSDPEGAQTSNELTKIRL